jgi:hypothetical protein
MKGYYNVDVPRLVPLEKRYPHIGYEIETKYDGWTLDVPFCWICMKAVDPDKAYSIHRSLGETALPFGARCASGYSEDDYGGLGWEYIGPTCKNKIPKDCLYPVGFNKTVRQQWDAFNA